MTKTAFITGSNRGIGLGLTQYYLGKGFQVFAAARNPHATRDFWELERDYGTRLQLVQMDVTKEQDVRDAIRLVGERPLDILINNAGVMPKDVPFPSVTDAEMRHGFEVNTLAPLRLAREFLPNLKAAHHPIVASITSRMGSIADNTSGRYYAYRMSKTALNMVMKSFSLDYPEIMTVVLHPGWVQTDMGGKGASVTVDDSAAGLGQVIDGMTKERSGGFFDYKGHAIHW